MNLVRPTRWIILLALTMAAGLAFGDTICIRTDATTYIPPPRPIEVQHFIGTASLQTDHSWSPAYGMSLANASWHSQKRFAPAQFSERIRHAHKGGKRANEPISVPEPSGLELLGVGLIGLAVAVRKLQT